MLFFVTPIMFPIKLLSDKGLGFIYQFNPLYYLIDVVRYPIIEGHLALAENYMFAGVYILTCWLMALWLAVKLDSRVVFLL
jgi:ABC-type polysaccharide/polyol phosphate export permease